MSSPHEGNRSRARLLHPLAAVAVLILSATASLAGVIITPPPGAPGNPDENVVFNKDGLNTTGTTVQGATNQTQRVLDIISGVSLTATGGQGQATVETTSGSPFQTVMFVPHTGSLPIGLLPLGAFTELEFNIDATADGTLTIDVQTNLGLFSENHALDANGQNRFNIEATGADVITKVTLTASGQIINNIKQIRLGGLSDPGGGGIDPPPTPDPVFTPEPASMLLWGVGALGAVALGWRRARKPSVN